MITVSGTLLSLSSAAEPGAGVLQLCGFGAQIPTVPGTGELARTKLPLVVNAATGAWSTPVVPNDQIVPAGTHYTLALQDSEGNTVQVAAYQFTNLPAGTVVDLSLFPPIDPTSLQPGTVPGALTNLLAVVPASAAPAIDGSVFRSFVLPLAAGVPVAGMTFSGGVPGNLYVFIVTQPAAPVAFAWAANMLNFAALPAAANLTLVQGAYCRADGSLQAFGGGVLVPAS